jgi:hypothetical protein
MKEIHLFRDILNELRRSQLISQSLANHYTMNQCHELKSSTPENQSIFLFYMMIQLIRTEGYIDEMNFKKFLQPSNIDKFHRILREGFLTIEQILQSTKDFFLQDVNHLFNFKISHRFSFSISMKNFSQNKSVNLKQ